MAPNRPQNSGSLPPFVNNLPAHCYPTYEDPNGPTQEEHKPDPNTTCYMGYCYTNPAPDGSTPPPRVPPGVPTLPPPPERPKLPPGVPPSSGPGPNPGDNGPPGAGPTICMPLKDAPRNVRNNRKFYPGVYPGAIAPVAYPGYGGYPAYGRIIY